MKIIFSPEYSGTVYAKSAEGKDVLMDTMVLNAIGLINLLELRLGLHYDNAAANERVALYYKAVSQYMAAHPQNVLAASFQISGLGTANAMLAWRDELRSADWNFGGMDVSERLNVLIDVEESFRKVDGKDMTDRIHIVLEQIELQKLDFSDITIELPVDKSLLKPLIKALIEKLEAHGAKTDLAQGATVENNLNKVRNLITTNDKKNITLDPNDHSLEIWEFPDERLTCEYLSFADMNDVDVWVNSDNKQMDNWLRLMNKPQTGSVTADCTPQLTQLFVMGLGMFDNPLNVNTLIEWLNMPIHPISKHARSILADTIVSEGGYRNEACKEIVKQYIEGKYVYLNDEQKSLPKEEQNEIILKDKPKRQKKVDVFLPPFDVQQTIKTDKVRLFVAELSAWASQQAHLMAGEVGNEQWIEQLMAVSAMCETFRILLETISDDTISYKTIDSWMSTIYNKGSYTNAVAERGCRTVVDSPAKIVSVAKKTVWIGVDGDTNRSQECAFLYPSEKAALENNGDIHSWPENDENSYHEQMLMTPLRMTSDKLILVVRKRIGGEPTMKHPLLVRLEIILDKEYNKLPKIDGEKLYNDIKSKHKVEPVTIGNDCAELKFKYADKIKWPDHMSPTTIGTLAQYPFDYLMERLLNITNDGKAQMADVKRTKGNVAHAVIEKLFAPRGEDKYSKPEEIAQRIKNEYAKVFDEVIDAKGALLQLIENRLNQKLLREQLHNCLDALLEILKDNELKVTGCERYVDGSLGLDLPTKVDDNGKEKDCDMLGFIDMTLEDKEGNPVVFDFKWSTWAKGYQNILKENRSVQLELYRWMLGKKAQKNVERVAYFLMPNAQLFSKEEFKGRNCNKIDPDNKDNIVDQIKQSAKYRMQQIKNGIVEINGNFDELQYVKDTESRGLFPLKKNDDGTKEDNFFSQYGLFY